MYMKNLVRHIVYEYIMSLARHALYMMRLARHVCSICDEASMMYSVYD